MADIASGEVAFGITKGTTWGTAAALSGARLIHGTYTLQTSRGVFSPTGVGFDNMIQEAVDLEESVQVSMTVDLRYGCEVFQAIAMVLGDDAVGAEITGSQADYLHTIKMTNKSTGLFSTFVSSIGTGSTDVLEIPSVKWTDFTINQSSGGVGTATVNGLGSNLAIKASATNALSALTGATYLNPVNFAALTGSPAYFRMNASSGAALDNTNDLQIMNYSFNVSRPFSPKRTLRGALTQYIIEPQQQGLTTGSLRVKFSGISTFDWLAAWAAKTYQKAEIFQSGAAIGTGSALSYKFIFPYMRPGGPLGSGFDAPNNNSLMEPDVTFDLHTRSAAPTGMTGHTNYASILATNSRVTAYDA